MTVLQTAPLPLGYDAIAIKSETSSKGPSSERWDSNPRPSRWQRDALPAELLSQNLHNTRSKFYIKYLCITTFFITNGQDTHHHHDHGDDDAYDC